MKFAKSVCQRRSFFKRLVVLGGTFMMVPLFGGKRFKAGAGGQSQIAGTSGYRQTPHVRKYYESLSPTSRRSG